MTMVEYESIEAHENEVEEAEHEEVRRPNVLVRTKVNA